MPRFGTDTSRGFCSVPRLKEECGSRVGLVAFLPDKTQLVMLGTMQFRMPAGNATVSGSDTKKRTEPNPSSGAQGQSKAIQISSEDVVIPKSQHLP